MRDAQTSSPDQEKQVDRPAHPAEIQVSHVREAVTDVTQAVPETEPLSYEREIRFMEAINTVDELLKRKKLTRSEIQTIQANMKLMEHESTALDAFGTSGVRRYFELLSGSSSDLPYLFTLRLNDRDLETYLMYDFLHDDPELQEQCALDYIDDPIDDVSLNIVISRLKANPDFFVRICDENRLFDGTPGSYIYKYVDSIKGNGRLSQAFQSLEHFLLSRRRVKPGSEYYYAKRDGKYLKARDLKKKIRKMDERFFSELLKE